jgi:hypothetical protein
VTSVLASVQLRSAPISAVTHARDVATSYLPSSPHALRLFLTTKEDGQSTFIMASVAHLHKLMAKNTKVFK